MARELPGRIIASLDDVMAGARKYHPRARDFFLTPEQESKLNTGKAKLFYEHPLSPFPQDPQLMEITWNAPSTTPSSQSSRET